MAPLGTQLFLLGFSTSDAATKRTSPTFLGIPTSLSLV